MQRRSFTKSGRKTLKRVRFNPSVAQQFLQLQWQCEVVTARVEQPQISQRAKHTKRVKREEMINAKAEVVSSFERASGQQ